MTDGHDTLTTCVEERISDPTDGAETISESTEDNHHEQVVKCNTCGREFTVIYPLMGAFDPEQLEYVREPEQFEKQTDDAYYDDGAYNIPITSEDGKPLELVHLRSHIEHGGEVVYEYDE